MLTIGISAVPVNANTTLTEAEGEKAEISYVTYFGDGGKDVVFIIDGTENHCLVPPSGFNPLLAADEDLDRYCFPPRPKDENDLAEWKQQMSYYKGTPEPELTVMVDYLKQENWSVRESSNTITDSIQGTASYTTTYNTHWSGYISNLGTSPSNTYSQVEMDYYQPDVSITSGDCKNLYWVGLGGKNNQKLVQAGTGTYGTSNHFAWYEYLSSSATTVPVQIINNLNVNYGNLMHVYIAFAAENNSFSYYIANNTTGYATSGFVNLNASDYYDGTTCEWILERASKNGFSHYNLGYFGNAEYSACKCKFLNNPSWYNLSSLTGLQRIVMTRNGNYSGPSICTPGGPSTHRFSFMWNGYN